MAAMAGGARGSLTERGLHYMPATSHTSAPLHVQTRVSERPRTQHTLFAAPPARTGRAARAAARRMGVCARPDPSPSRAARPLRRTPSRATGADAAGLAPAARDEARLCAHHGHHHHACQRRPSHNDTGAAPSCME
jgi:hypothetical protein